MDRIPQTTPMSRLNTNQAEVLDQVQKGPVLLLSRSTPVGVLVSVDEWNHVAEQLEQLAFLKEFVRKKRLSAGQSTVSLDEIKQLTRVPA